MLIRYSPKEIGNAAKGQRGRRTIMDSVSNIGMYATTERVPLVRYLQSKK